MLTRRLDSHSLLLLVTKAQLLFLGTAAEVYLAGIVLGFFDDLGLGFFGDLLDPRVDSSLSGFGEVFV